METNYTEKDNVTIIKWLENNNIKEYLLNFITGPALIGLSIKKYTDTIDIDTKIKLTGIDFIDMVLVSELNQLHMYISCGYEKCINRNNFDNIYEYANHVIKYIKYDEYFYNMWKLIIYIIDNDINELSSITEEKIKDLLDIIKDSEKLNND